MNQDIHSKSEERLIPVKQNPLKTHIQDKLRQLMSFEYTSKYNKDPSSSVLFKAEIMKI